MFQLTVRSVWWCRSHENQQGVSTLQRDRAGFELQEARQEAAEQSAGASPPAGPAYIIQIVCFMKAGIDCVTGASFVHGVTSTGGDHGGAGGGVQPRRRPRRQRAGQGRRHQDEAVQGTALTVRTCVCGAPLSVVTRLCTCTEILELFASFCCYCTTTGQESAGFN